MKIYILRHEDRTIDCTFFSPLTNKGLDNSLNLVKYLKPLDINEIHCSPFIRTLQTIIPFVKSSKKKIKLEYGLIEIKNEEIIPVKSHNVELPEYLKKIFNCDLSYQTLINTNDIKFPESSENLEIRVKKVLNFIISNNYKTEKNILIVTHQGVCQVILKIINKSKNITYPLGELSLIFDKDKWCYKKITPTK